MSSITDRYARAVRSSNLKGSAETMADGTDPARTAGAVDVLGAFGLAAKQQGLAVALTRLFMGDKRAVLGIVDILGSMVDNKAYATGVEITRLQALDLGRAVLAWVQFGTCKACNGLGHAVIAGTTTLGGDACKHCKGTGRIPFDSNFPLIWLDLARWLLSEIEAGMGRAGPAAMAKLAPRLDL